MSSHQTGVILNHWNDCPNTVFIKNKSASNSSTNLGLPTPPTTPSLDNESLILRLQSLLDMSTRLNGRNKEMIFTRIQILIKSIEERKVPGISRGNRVNEASQCTALEEIVSFVETNERSSARDRIIKLMSEERGIASWATSLRMVIENLS